jgi:glycosyltransferase involved in cell wall biosynthesis
MSVGNNYISLNKHALEDAGHEVYVFTFGDPEYQDDEPRVIRSPALPLADTGFYLSLRHKTKHKKLLQTMDVIHVHHPFLSGRLALNYCRSAKIPVVFTNHSRYDLLAQAYLPIMPDEMSHGLLQAYLPEFCESVDLVISPSEGMAKILREFDVRVISRSFKWVDLRQFHQARPFPRSQFDLQTRHPAGVCSRSRRKRTSISCYSPCGVATHSESLPADGRRRQETVRGGKFKVSSSAWNRKSRRSTGMSTYEDIPSTWRWAISCHDIGC